MIDNSALQNLTLLYWPIYAYSLKHLMLLRDVIAAINYKKSNMISLAKMN